jgi:hypothetical protein
VTAYREMLPATERLVAHHLRRRLLATATERVAEGLGADAPPSAGPERGGPDRGGPDLGPPDRGGPAEGGA